MGSLDVFCRQIRARSEEHRLAVAALHSLPGQMVSVLRQELDSLVRVVYLLAQDDRGERQRLIKDAAMGRKWTHAASARPVTDREMVDLTDGLHGWTKSVYAFGCGFIHLSHLHDYKTRDPLQQIPAAERVAVLGHLRTYHGGPGGPDPMFADIVPMLPAVFDKIAGNLENYLKELERDGDLDGDPHPRAGSCGREGVEHGS